MKKIMPAQCNVGKTQTWNIQLARKLKTINAKSCVSKSKHLKMQMANPKEFKQLN